MPISERGEATKSPIKSGQQQRPGSINMNKSSSSSSNIHNKQRACSADKNRMDQKSGCLLNGCESGRSSKIRQPSARTENCVDSRANGSRKSSAISCSKSVNASTPKGDQSGKPQVKAGVYVYSTCSGK